MTTRPPHLRLARALGVLTLAAFATAGDTATRHWDCTASFRRLRRRPRPADLVGYSGGGGIATLVAASLPADVAIDRLILIAPAISPDYPLAGRVLPHVRELAVSFASGRDLQVGWGTHELGTIDRVYTPSAGAVGFNTRHERLLEYFWSDADLGLGHQGNHWSYLVRRWQDAKLLPALDPSVTAVELRAQWAAACEET